MHAPQSAISNLKSRGMLAHLSEHCQESMHPVAAAFPARLARTRPPRLARMAGAVAGGQPRTTGHGRALPPSSGPFGEV